MTEEQWYKDPDLQPRLAEILRDPALLAALEIVRDQEIIPVVAPNGVGNLVDFFALMGAKRLGYGEALKNLRGLAQSKTTPPENPRKPWESDPVNPQK